jgi:putative transposase
MKYEFIDSHRSDYRLMRMCKVLAVSQSGYHSWRKREPRPRELEDQQIVQEMLEIHERHYRSYGGVRMKRALEKQGIYIGLSRVYRLMRQHGIYTVHRIRHRPQSKGQGDGIYQDNILNRQFNPPSPNTNWVGDITYIRSKEGWVYLAVVLDLFNREVVGWAMSRKADTELVIRALAHALVRRNYPQDVMFHSDRGCQYSSKRFQKFLEQYHVSGSMSRKGNPFDNSCCESFFATIKKEWIYFHKYANLRSVEANIFEYVEVFYNRRRMHASLGYLSPKQFLDRYLREIAA